MPIMQAFPLGLPLQGTTSIILADGTKHTRLCAVAEAHLSDRTKSGIVILEESAQDVLIGMDFLRAFKLTLVVGNGRVLLYDNGGVTGPDTTDSSKG